MNNYPFSEYTSLVSIASISYNRDIDISWHTGSNTADYIIIESETADLTKLTTSLYGQLSTFNVLWSLSLRLKTPTLNPCNELPICFR